jgi:hypothetical protein
MNGTATVPAAAAPATSTWRREGLMFVMLSPWFFNSLHRYSRATNPGLLPARWSTY